MGIESEVRDVRDKLMKAEQAAATELEAIVKRHSDTLSILIQNVVAIGDYMRRQKGMSIVYDRLSDMRERAEIEAKTREIYKIAANEREVFPYHTE